MSRSNSKTYFSNSRALLVATTIILVLFCAPLSFSMQSERNKAGVVKSGIPDLAVVDQNGKRTLFYSQLLKGKVVAINFVYTTCTAFCAAQGASFSKLQAALGDEVGKSVNLITITTDPDSDTPERLKTWSEPFKAKQGWTMITGEKKSIDEILKSLTGDIGRKGMHSPIILIGNPDKGVWVRENGLAEPERTVATIKQMMSDNQ